jgi:hypothetical protein
MSFVGCFLLIALTGNIGVSPITANTMTGFSLTLHSDSEGEYSALAQIMGKAYMLTCKVPIPVALTTGFTDTAGGDNTHAARINLRGGLLGGAFDSPNFTLMPGVYTFGTNLNIITPITFHGTDTDVFNIQIMGNLIQAANKMVKT